MADSEKRFIALKLFEFRKKIYGHYKTVTGAEAQLCVEAIFKLTNALGNLLIILGQFSLAR